MTKPLSQMTEEELQALREANAKASKEAIEMANRQMMEDQRNGQKPVVETAADMILDALKQKFPADKTQYDGEGSGEGDPEANR